MVVEVDGAAEALVEARATRRLIALELADIDLPPPIDHAAGVQHSLFIRVLGGSDHELLVELWEQGAYHGSRRVSASDRGPLGSRRIALVAAELVRQLGRQRRAESLRAAREARVRETQARAWPGVPIFARPALAATGTVASVGRGDYWLAGPGLEASFRATIGPRVALGAAWLAGTTEDAARVRWLELSLAPAYSWVLSPSLALEVGALAAVASLRVGVGSGGAALAGHPVGELDTWSARAAGRVRLEARLGDALAVGVGPELGASLHPVRVAEADGGSHSLGGLWLGASVSLVVDPWWSRPVSRRGADGAAPGTGLVSGRAPSQAEP